MTLKSSYYAADDAAAVDSADRELLEPILGLCSWDTMCQSGSRTPQLTRHLLTYGPNLHARPGDSIYDMLDRDAAPDEIDSWRDAQGRMMPGPHEKRSIMWSTGDVVMLNVRVYQWDMALQQFGVPPALRDRPVSFPLEGLDLTKYEIARK